MAMGGGKTLGLEGSFLDRAVGKDQHKILGEMLWPALSRPFLQVVEGRVAALEDNSLKVVERRVAVLAPLLLKQVPAALPAQRKGESGTLVVLVPKRKQGRCLTTL